MPLAESANSVLLKGDSFSPVRLSLRETLGTLLMIDDMQMVVNGLEYRAFQMLSKIDTSPMRKPRLTGARPCPHTRLSYEDALYGVAWLVPCRERDCRVKRVLTLLAASTRGYTDSLGSSSDDIA